MHTRRNFLILALVLLAILFVPAAMRAFAAADASASLTSVQGEVRVGDLTGARAGDSVTIGSAIRTLENGTLSLALANGLSLTLYPNSSAYYRSDDGDGRASFSLAHGALAMRREGGGIEKNRLSIVTPQLVVFLRGTTSSAAIVSLHDETHTDLFVTKGSASLRGLQSDENANGVSLYAGMMTTIDEEASASEPREFSERDLPRVLSAQPQSSPRFAYIWMGGLGLLAVILGFLFARRRRLRSGLGNNQLL